MRGRPCGTLLVTSSRGHVPEPGTPEGGRLNQLPRQTARVRDAVAPGWLVEIVRTQRAPPPWPLMIRAAVAICVPLAAGFAAHELALGLLPAIGGLITSAVDVGGPYWSRVRRVGSATVFGGAIGMTVGVLIHGRGWVAVVALVLVAGASVLLSEVGSVAAVTGLQLLVYTAVGFGLSLTLLRLNVPKPHAPALVRNLRPGQAIGPAQPRSPFRKMRTVKAGRRR